MKDMSGNNLRGLLKHNIKMPYHLLDLCICIINKASNNIGSSGIKILLKTNMEYTMQIKLSIFILKKRWL
jgi:hypothetical protein